MDVLYVVAIVLILVAFLFVGELLEDAMTNGVDGRVKKLFQATLFTIVLYALPAMLSFILAIGAIYSMLDSFEQKKINPEQHDLTIQQDSVLTVNSFFRINTLSCGENKFFPVPL